MPCTRQCFNEITDDPETAKTIQECRQLYAAGDTKRYHARKQKLPMFIFMTDHFLPNKGSKGKLPENTWRLQTAAVLNGLVMHDYDHLSQKGTTPVKVFHSIPDHWFDDKTCRTAIMYAGVTPSGDGLRLVTLADPDRGNIADNQQYVATCLGQECDEACKNADRTSFAVDRDSILFINESIFDYDNKEFDEKYSNLYRGAHSAATVTSHDSAAVAAGSADGQPAGQPDGAADEGAGGREQGVVEELEYYGTSFKAINDAYAAKFGVPAMGKRHKYLLTMAGRYRALVENNSGKLDRIFRQIPWVQDWLKEPGAGAEYQRVLSDIAAYKGGYSVGPIVKSILVGLGCNDPDLKSEDGAAEELSGAGRTFWSRLERYVAGPYLPAIAGVSDENKVGAVMAAGAMYCTLMTRCHYLHYDGELHRMNPQVYIIGDPASGKSFADRLDRNIMAAMRYADQPARDAEERYKKESKARSTSSKAQKGEALERPEGMIRYLPARTSNAIFYRRAVNAKEVINGEVMPLHLYTFDSELDSTITAQSGGSWIGKHDLELKAFHNELSGVDYANNDSVNQLIPIYWNQVITGTPISLGKKITMRNVNDGLCSRMAIFRMASHNFQMIGRSTAAVNHEQEVELKAWGFYFEGMKGELKIGRLIDHVYSLCEQSALEAEANNDKVLDFLRKRAVFYATWFTIPQIVGRLRGEKGKTLADIEVTDDDLKFATVMYDAVLYYQDRFFGQMLQDSWENAKREFVPRQRTSRNAELYTLLPDTFSKKEAIEKLGISDTATNQQLGRWVQAGYLERVKYGVYKKLIKEITV
ncbi:MAG: hypothetical protein II822_04550 [Prevotella sp.]|nr:hypothetical protein [Prevotella sp.]